MSRLKCSDQPNNIVEILTMIFCGMLLGALVMFLIMSELHHKKLDIIQEDVVALYSSFNECYKINSELLEGYENAN